MDSLQTLMSQLSDKDLLTMLALQLGYEEVPVDIETFLNDEYYLGKSCGINPLTGKSAIFPIWHEALAKVYPDPIRTSTYVANCGCTGCLHGDTKVKLLDGRSIPIKELFERYPNGGFQVYSFDVVNHSFEAGTCSRVYYNGKKQLMKITIKDKDGNLSSIKCTNEHKFLLTSGIYKTAGELLIGQSIESLYFKYNSKFYRGYQEFFDNNKGRWYPTHRWVAGERTFNGTVVHHLDENKLNNDSQNLQVFSSASEHSRLHANEFWSDDKNRESVRQQTANRNKSGEITKCKLKKFCSILKAEDICIDNITLDDLNKIRLQFIEQGFLDYKSKVIVDLDEFLDLYKKSLPDYSYQDSELIARNKNAYSEQQKRTQLLNKNHPRLRNDITLTLVIKTAQDHQECRYDKLAELLGCSRNRIASVLSEQFKYSADFYEFIGIKPTKEAYQNRYKFVKNLVSDIGSLDFNLLSHLTTYSHEKLVRIILQYNESLKSFADALAIEFQNHTIVSIEYLDEYTDVYDMTVDTYHNYGIEDDNGNIIFVHNSGKSTMSKIIIAYDIYKLTKLKDPAGYFGLIQKYLHFVVFNLTKENAEKMVKELKSWLEESPYFQEQKKDNQSVYQWVCIDPASRMQDIISNDVITIVYSEMNFVNNFEQGIKLINQGISRIEGRFQKGLGLFNHVVLDSSDSTIDAPVPNFLRFHPRGPETLVFSYAIWEAKRDMYFHITDPETGKKTFTVYKGDSEIMPCIVTKDTKTENMDPDRFLEVPLELLPDFQADIELNLNDKAGVAVETTTQYFKAAYVTPHMTYDMGGIPEIISIDFFNGETYQPYFEDLMQKLPKDRCLFGRLDLGLVKDKAGFAIGYIESMNEKNLDGIVTYDPSVVIPCAVSFSRYTGQETNIDKLTDLIIWMHSKIPFFRFTTDQYQSSAIRQRLIIAGIQADLLSVDRKTDAYKVAKQMIYQGKVQLPKCTLLKNELLNLMDLGKKIDHHETLNANGDIGSDSKDVADALAGLLYTMHEATPEAMDPPILSNTQWEEYNKRILEGWVEESQKRYIKQTNSFNFGETAFFGHELDL